MSKEYDDASIPEDDRYLEATNSEASGNTGAQTPFQYTGTATGAMLCLIDYISCTFPFHTDSELRTLQMKLGGEWITTARGTRGYKRGLRSGGVSLWYDGRPEMGVNLEATGDGCRELEARGVSDWQVCLGGLLAMGAKFCRVDVALDDFAGVLDLGEIETWCRSGLAVSRFKSIEPRQSLNPVTGQVTKSGFTFGNRKSETYLRIYDKALLENTDRHHVRVELETKDGTAHRLACKLAERGEGIIAGVIGATVDFKVRGRDSHRHRWATQPTWREFIGEVEKVPLSRAPAERTLEKSVLNVQRQYGPTLAMIQETLGPEKLDEIIRNGEGRLRQKHRSMMAKHQRKKPRE